jgi:PGF-pre-PGF domain-containing protein
VKDQGYYGTCWSFASLASLESTGIPTSGIRDYSEKHVVNLDGFDPGVDDGGDSLMSTAYLTRWEGPVYEEEDPYPGNSGWTSSPAGLSEKVHCQDVLFLSCDLTRIKEAVKEMGAVSTNFIVNWTCFKENETHAAYYYNGSPHLRIDGSHAVTIVGWDDTYDRSEFAAVPPGDGAIICKNSWGTNWGDAGYFYLSYYDESFNSSSVQPAQPAVFTAEPVTNYDNIYQYDPYGWVRSVRVLGAGDFTYAANVFNASGEEQVTAVGFYTPTTDCDYVIYIYRGSEYVTAQTGTIGDAGFHTVALDNPAGIRAGETFTVYLGLRTPGYDYPICVEMPIAGYSSNASASPGESYISGDGTHWADISSADTNVCLKAYTQAIAVPDFMANVTGGPAPLTVRFTDCSAGSPTAWNWTFGDGATSTNRNPTHTYPLPGTYTVNLTVSNARGSDDTVKTSNISVTLPHGNRTQDVSLDIPGCNVTPEGDGRTHVSINISRTGAGITGNTITIPQENYTLTFETEDAPVIANGTVIGTVRNITLATNPIATMLDSLGMVNASVSAHLTGLPEGAGLTTTLSQNISPDARSAFQLAADTDGLNLGEIAYTMNIVKTNLTNGQDIAGAVIRMAVSHAWVESHGGAGAIRIIRSAEDGTKEMLATRLIGTDADGSMVFEAVSPNGLSIFGLAAVSPVPQPARSSSGGGGASTTSVGVASDLEPGENITLVMDKTAVSAVVLTASTTVGDVMVTVAKGSLSGASRPPTGTVYQYVETTLYKAAEDDFESVRIQFAVQSDWLAAHGCTGSQVALFRYAGYGWQEVPVEVLGEENGNALFSTEPNRFGLFAIATAGSVSDTTATERVGPETTPAVDVTTTLPQIKSMAFPDDKSPVGGTLPMTVILVIVGAVVIVGAAGYLLVKRR